MVGSELDTTPDRVDPHALHDCGQLGLLCVAAPEASEKSLAAEAGEVHRNVGCATGPLIALRMADYRDRGLG